MEQFERRNYTIKNYSDSYHHKECPRIATIIKPRPAKIFWEKKISKNQQKNSINHITFNFLKLVEFLLQEYTKEWFLTDPRFYLMRKTYLKYKQYVYFKILKKTAKQQQMGQQSNFIKSCKYLRLFHFTIKKIVEIIKNRIKKDYTIFKIYRHLFWYFLIAS